MTHRWQVAVGRLFTAPFLCAHRGSQCSAELNRVFSHGQVVGLTVELTVELAQSLGSRQGSIVAGVVCYLPENSSVELLCLTDVLPLAQKSDRCGAPGASVG